ncbi:hypothetical protein [Saccharomonospora viridis]|nr:hypothetical protein [Saccharomonospora viridis]
MVPLFMLCLIKNSEVPFGYRRVKLNGTPTSVWDLMGEDTVLFHHSVDADDETMASHYVKQSRMWFDSLWTSVAREWKR